MRPHAALQQAALFLTTAHRRIESAALAHTRLAAALTHFTMTHAPDLVPALRACYFEAELTTPGPSDGGETLAAGLVSHIIRGLSDDDAGDANTLMSTTIADDGDENAEAAVTVSASEGGASAGLRCVRALVMLAGQERGAGMNVAMALEPAAVNQRVRASHCLVGCLHF